MDYRVASILARCVAAAFSPAEFAALAIAAGERAGLPCLEDIVDAVASANPRDEVGDLRVFPKDGPSYPLTEALKRYREARA